MKIEEASLDFDFGHKGVPPKGDSKQKMEDWQLLWREFLRNSGGSQIYSPNGGGKQRTGSSELVWIDLSDISGIPWAGFQSKNAKLSFEDLGWDIDRSQCRIVTSGKDGQPGSYLVCDGSGTNHGSGKAPSADDANGFENHSSSDWFWDWGVGQFPSGTIPRCVHPTDKLRPDGGKDHGNKDHGKKDHGNKGSETEKQDTSYKVEDFPCSENKEKPCRGKEIKTWQKAVLPWGGEYQQPGPPKPYKFKIEYDFPVILTLVDTETQSEHFLLKMDGEYLGDTGGEDGYTNQYIGDYNNPEWCLTNGYTRGYFRIPAGKHSRVK
jgi:hypothetical protein